VVGRSRTAPFRRLHQTTVALIPAVALHQTTTAPFAGLYRSTRSPPALLPSAKLHQTTTGPSAPLLDVAFEPRASSCRLGSQSGGGQRKLVGDGEDGG
jgi:hypothetical protein